MPSESFKNKKEEAQVSSGLTSAEPKKVCAEENKPVETVEPITGPVQWSFLKKYNESKASKAATETTNPFSQIDASSSSIKPVLNDTQRSASSSTSKPTWFLQKQQSVEPNKTKPDLEHISPTMSANSIETSSNLKTSLLHRSIPISKYSEFSSETNNNQAVETVSDKQSKPPMLTTTTTMTSAVAKSRPDLIISSQTGVENNGTEVEPKTANNVTQPKKTIHWSAYSKQSETIKQSAESTAAQSPSLSPPLPVSRITITSRSNSVVTTADTSSRQTSAQDKKQGKEENKNNFVPQTKSASVVKSSFSIPLPAEISNISSG